MVNFYSLRLLLLSLLICQENFASHLIDESSASSSSSSSSYLITKRVIVTANQPIKSEESNISSPLSLDKRVSLQIFSSQTDSPQTCNPLISGNGEKLYFNTENSEIKIYDVKTQSFTRLALPSHSSSSKEHSKSMHLRKTRVFKVSFDGTFAVGNVHERACYWKDGKLFFLESQNLSSAFSFSDNLSTIIGEITYKNKTSNSLYSCATIWQLHDRAYTAKTFDQPITHFTDINCDGQKIVGVSDTSSSHVVSKVAPFFYLPKKNLLSSLTNSYESGYTSGISRDGSRIIGICSFQISLLVHLNLPCYWVWNEERVSSPILLETLGTYSHGEVTAVSDNGSIMVGRVKHFPRKPHAVVWFKDRCIPLEVILQRNNLKLPNLELEVATSISHTLEGIKIVGTSTYNQTPNIFVLTLTEEELTPLSWRERLYSYFPCKLSSLEKRIYSKKTTH